MMNDLPPGLADPESAHDAYNAVFYELGLRWHWDRETYAALLRHSPDPQARIRHYLETRQPHLLTAYDAGALAAEIQQRVLRQKALRAPALRLGPGCRLRSGHLRSRPWNAAASAS